MSEVMCCPLDGGDCDAPEFWDQTWPVARKPHSCCECSEEIPRGARHERVNAKWRDFGSHIQTMRTCMLCVEIRDHFACGEGYMIGEVWNQLEENFFPDMKAGGPCMEGLSPEGKRKLVDARMEWYFGLDEIDDGVWEDWEKKRSRSTIDHTASRTV